MTERMTAVQIPSLLEVGGYWLPSHRGDERAIALYRRHYSAAKNDSVHRSLRNFMAPGETMVLLTPDCRAVFAWSRNTVPRWDKQQGIICTLFRNEGQIQSSELVREADELAWKRWPDDRHFTYVDGTAVKSSNPGYCFKRAGWRLVYGADGTPARTGRGLLLLEHVR